MASIEKTVTTTRIVTEYTCDCCGYKFKKKEEPVDLGYFTNEIDLPYPQCLRGNLGDLCPRCAVRLAVLVQEALAPLGYLPRHKEMNVLDQQEVFEKIKQVELDIFEKGEEFCYPPNS